MIALAILAQLSAPVPSKPLLTPADVPMEIMEENVLHTVGIAVTVKPDGRVQSCLVEKSSGNRKLDSYTCKLLTRRARFRRPTHIDGSPAYGLYRTGINWWAGNGYPPRRLPLADLYLTVSKLPPKLESPLSVRLKVAVDPTGRASHCLAEDSKEQPELVRLGCEQLLKSYQPSPVRSEAGVPVASVQSATVVIQTN